MNTNESDQIDLSQVQIDQLSSLNVINRIDDHLRIVSSIDVARAAEHLPARVTLFLEIYFDNQRVDTMSFGLNNYSYDEIIHLAKNIRDNEFIMHEVDIFLSGDIIE